MARPGLSRGRGVYELTHREGEFCEVSQNPFPTYFRDWFIILNFKCLKRKFSLNSPYSWIITSSERTSAKLLYWRLKAWTAKTRDPRTDRCKAFFIGAQSHRAVRGSLPTTLKNKTTIVLKNFIKGCSEPGQLVYKPMLLWQGWIYFQSGDDELFINLACFVRSCLE